ncbi:FadR family transcriptional regulator [Calidifontibacter sp. DB0510]|uniref:FadR family transcriptional regulator n=1 Tax=Metallococcus carri TaxID=1656884 RepID=A0A967EH50_9MICO|nr:FCD domain-containing protein [Metallococcus carri]NHN55923.1 FadR family transcriptional regulator [Metallococcus carri]NOP38389.1 FadR family transcriptional regulator [Calidifontibacter sp. DB2511S]
MTSSGSRPQRAWEQVVAWVEDRVLDGRLVRGATLPAERDLAQQLGVSRAAVREGVRTLQASGVLRSAVGAGTAGGTTISGVPDEALTRLLSLHVALANFPPYDVTQARVALERASVGLAAVHASPEQRTAMRAALAAMDDDELSMADFNLHDTVFHVEIARAAGNRLVTDLTVAIRESMRRPILAGLEALDDWLPARDALRHEHHAIMTAIEEHRGEDAADLMQAHIWSAFERMPSLHPNPAKRH